ncbi:Protein of unknown function DUF1178 [Paracoccaceae bacterium]|jgi:hypothetical protein
MIRYTLKCPEGHRFDSWFQNAAGFEKLQAAGQLACAVCGTSAVNKDMMAPGVHTAPAVAATTDPQKPAPNLTEPGSDLEKAITAWRKNLTENSEYVGVQFAAEARRIHEGTAPERMIHGEARPEDARKLIEDGFPIAPLPFAPTRKVN